MKYLIYLRVSTEKQEESGLGIEAQQAACIEYIKRNGNHPYKIFKDEAVSGSVPLEDREGLSDALENLNKGDILLVSSRDRLGRDVIHNAIAEREVEKKGCRLIAVNSDDSLMDAGMSRLMKTVADAFAQYEKYQISKRTKAALAAKKARGERIGHVPYGYELCKTSKKLVICPSEAKILKAMYSYRRDHKLGFRGVSVRLNDIGYRNRDGALWNHGSTSRLYVNWLKICEDDPVLAESL